MLPLHKLESQGFLVLHRAVSIEAVNAFRAIARRTPLPWADAERLPTRAITFCPAAGRLYAEIPPVLATVLSTMLQRYYRTFFPNAVVTWYFVKTRAGTPNQPIHRNFAPADHPMGLSSVPGCLSIATTDDTRFVGFGWNHQVAFQSKKTEIKLQMGDMLFLRDDFIHSQATCSYNSICVHAFMSVLPAGNPWQRAQLVPLYDDGPRRDEFNSRCYVWGCQHVATSQQGLNRHVRESHGFFFNNLTLRDRHDTVGEPSPGIAISDSTTVSLSISIRPSDIATVDSEGEVEMEILVATDSDTDLEPAGDEPLSDWNLL